MKLFSSNHLVPGQNIAPQFGLLSSFRSVNDFLRRRNHTDNLMAYFGVGNFVVADDVGWVLQKTELKNGEKVFLVQQQVEKIGTLSPSE